MATTVMAQDPVRQLVGSQGQQNIRLQTFILNNDEYIRADQIISFFPNRWNYDPLTGTLRLTRTDGSRLGIKLGDQRIVINDTIIHTGMPPVRHQGAVFIPFAMVFPHFFPNTDFKEDDSTEQIAQAQPTPTTSAFNFFAPPTPTPVPRSDTPIPTYSSYPTATPLSASPVEPEPNYITLTIVLDPGHSPEYPGALAPNGLREADITMTICRRIASVLQSQGKRFDVVLTRGPGATAAIPPEERTSTANSNNADLFLSIHCGAFRQNDVSRGAVYFMNKELDSEPNRQQQKLAALHNLNAWSESYKTHMKTSREIAAGINTELTSLYNITNIIRLDSNPRPGRFHVLRGLTMPGILLELGNLNHATTAAYLSSERHQEEIANHIADAIIKTMPLEKPNQQTTGTFFGGG